MTVRRARAEDLPALLDLESQFPGDRLSPRQLRRHLKAPSARFLVATEAGRVCGYALVFTRRGSRCARLYSIAVHAAMQGKGIGRSLLEAVLHQLKSGRFRELRLEVRVDNGRAQALYRQLGFTEFGRKHVYYEDGSDALRLRLKLL